MRLLFVEDEPRFADALSHQLRKHGYLVDWHADGESGLDAALTGSYDLLILDRMLPRLDGLALLREFRAQNHTEPVLFLTARDACQDRVIGLDAGADDYLIKPFAIDELLARIRALFRRKEKDFCSSLSSGFLTLEPQKSEVSIGDAPPVSLSMKETQLLEFLMRNSGQVLTKEQIFFKVWGNSDSDFANVDLYIHYLRKKLPPNLIRTIRGIGYCFEAPK